MIIQFKVCDSNLEFVEWQKGFTKRVEILDMSPVTISDIIVGDTSFIKTGIFVTYTEG